jgi:hypothetical protein
METAVFIDSCAWNCLFERGVDLAEAFPPDEYALAVTREVEIEIAAIPDKGKDGADKVELKAYIRESIERNRVRTTSVFGFATYEPDGSLSKVQVYGGFGHGTWQSDADRRWYGSNEVKGLLHGKGKRKSGLSDNQADASLAVRSFESIVLTDEVKTKNGPLRLAAEQGGRVVYLADVWQSGLSLKEFVRLLKSGADSITV